MFIGKLMLLTCSFLGGGTNSATAIGASVHATVILLRSNQWDPGLKILTLAHSEYYVLSYLMKKTIGRGEGGIKGSLGGDDKSPAFRLSWSVMSLRLISFE